MRITFIHKPGAGGGSHSKKKLLRRLERAGHEVAYFSADEDRWETALDDAGDLVLVGGGDGTVGSVARRLFGRRTPLAILPLGTANNVATKLGCKRDPDRVVAQLNDAEPRPFNLGVARGPWGTHRFLEGVGVGPFARAMAFLDAEWDDLVHEPGDRKKELLRDARLLRAFLHESIPHRWTATIDGELVEGPFVLIEVMNTGLIGPNLCLAPGADPGDGWFDVALVRDADRQAFAAYLDRYLDGDRTPPHLPVRRAREVRLSLETARVHVDDELWPAADRSPPPLDAAFEVDVRLESETLTVLVPR